MLLDSTHAREEELRHFRGFQWALILLSALNGSVYLVTGFLFHQAILLIAGGSLYLSFPMQALAGRLASRGRLPAAALLVGYTLLLLTVLNGPFFTVIAPTLALVPFVAAALVVPLAGGSALGLFLAATLAAELAVAGFGVTRPGQPHFSPATEVYFALTSMAALAALILVLLLQYRTRVFRALERLHEAVWARDEFISIASHELLTPLTPLTLNAAGLMRAKAQRPAPPVGALGGTIENIDRQIRRLSRLLNELLDISRIATGRMTFELEEVDLGEACREVVSGYQAELTRAGCDVLLHLGLPSVRGKWDRHRLEQVLWNLLSNAAKFGKGQPIEIFISESAGMAQVRVRDQGIGISTEDQRRIFEQFERAVSTRHYGGFGLGLWISRRIVESMGGSIWVQSQPGQGSTFGFQLPQAPEQRAGSTGSQALPRERPPPPSLSLRSRTGRGPPRYLEEVEVEERRHLGKFLRLFSFAASVFGAVQLTAALLISNRELALFGFTSVLALAVSLWSRQLLRRDQPRAASLVLGYTILLLPVINSPFFTLVSPTLAVLPFVAVALVFPHLRGRALHAFLVATLIAELTVATLAVLFPNRPSAPPLLVVLLSLSSMAAAASLILLLLLQFRARVVRSLRLSEEAVRARDHFISLASQELLTPLTPLSLHTSALMQAARRGPSSPVDTLSGKIDGVDRQIHHLSQLVKELLDISRLSRRQMRLEYSSVDLGEMSREVVSGYQAELARSGCAVSLRVDPAGVRGEWDRQRLEQVLWNLLSNAAKFGEGHPIQISIVSAQGVAELKMRDHGIGIRLEDQRRIFEQFERAVGAQQYGGFGLGLWISREIVESMDGSLEVESAPGKGSTFTLRLPLRARTRPSAVPPGRKRTGGRVRSWVRASPDRERGLQ